MVVSANRVVRWLRKRVPLLWKGVRVVLALVEGAALLVGEEALAAVARALLVVGDVIVEAGRHGRS